MEQGAASVVLAAVGEEYEDVGGVSVQLGVMYAGDWP